MSPMLRLQKQRVIELVGSTVRLGTIGHRLHEMYADDLRAEILFGIPLLWDGESPIKADDFACRATRRAWEDREAGIEYLNIGAFVDAANEAVESGAKVTPLTVPVSTYSAP